MCSLGLHAHFHWFNEPKLAPKVNTIWYFRAPPKFEGDVSAAYDQLLTFDLRQEYTSHAHDDQDVILTGAGITLVFDFDIPEHPDTHWTAYRFLLNESAGWINKATGEPPTHDEMNIVLSSLDSLQIHGSYHDYYTTNTYLDNVVLNGDCLLGSIDGKIKDALTEEPIDEAIVIAIDIKTKEMAGITFTDDDGYYKIIPDLEPGIYLVLAIKKGYQPGVKVAKVEVCGTTPVDFMLSPKPE